MSTMADQLAAALEPLSSETKAALARLLLGQAGVPDKAARKPRGKSKVDLLLDTRTVAELWLAGEDHAGAQPGDRQGREGRRVPVDPGDLRRWLHGAHRLVHARRWPRQGGRGAVCAGSGMERTFERQRSDWFDHCERLTWEGLDWRGVVPEPEPFRWVTLPDGTQPQDARLCRAGGRFGRVRADGAGGAAGPGRRGLRDCRWRVLPGRIMSSWRGERGRCGPGLRPIPCRCRSSVRPGPSWRP